MGCGPCLAHTAAKKTAQSTPTNADAADAFKPNSESTGIPTISTVPALSTTSGSIANSDSYLWVPANVFRPQDNYKRKQQQPVIAQIYGSLIAVVGHYLFCHNTFSSCCWRINLTFSQVRKCGNGWGKQLYKAMFISVLLLVGLNRQTSNEPKIYKIGDMTQHVGN